MRLRKILAACLFFSMCEAAFAKDEMPENCVAADEMIKVLDKFNSKKASRIDTVAAVPSMAVTPPVQRIYFENGETRLDLVKNHIGAFDLRPLMGRSREGRLCRPLPATPIDVEINMRFAFKNAGGTHSIDELKDGQNDGRWLMQRVAPVPVRMMIPKFSHLAVQPLNGPVETLKIVPMKAGQPLGPLALEPLKNSLLFSRKQLEEMGADAISITGGAYQLRPSPSPKKLKELQER